MEPIPLAGEARVTSWRVFVLVLLSAAYFFQSSGHNEAARFDQIRSVTEHGEWWIDRFAWNSADTVRVGDHTYPNKAPGTTLLGAMPWMLTRAVMRTLPLDETKQLVLVTWVLTIAMSALPSALTSLLLLRFLARSGWSIAQSTLLSLGYGLGTIAFPWATTFFGHQLAAFFAFGPFYLIWSSRFVEGRARALRLLLAGLMIGFLPVIEYPGFIASALVGLYAIATVGWRGSLPLILGAMVGVLPLPLYNQIAFGSPQALSYGFYQEGGAFPTHRQGFMGVSWPRLDVLREITYRPQRGLFHANPWLAFGLLAPFFIRRIRGLGREFGTCAAILVSFFLFNAGFGDSIIYWGGAFSFGPRHLLIALPFAVLLVAAPLKSRLLGPVIAILIVATIFLMLPAAAIDPRLPYEPAEPFFGFYLPLFVRGLFSTYPWATFAESPIFGSSGAFNLGRVMRMPSDLEVLPLTLLWALFAMGLFKAPNRGARGARILAAGLAVAIGLLPALPRLLSDSRMPGLCQAVSKGEMWPYFSDYALQEEPGLRPARRRVPSPSILPTNQAGTQPAKVAVTFSGYFEPAAPAWYVFRVAAIGRAALYVDGLHRLKIEGGSEVQQVRAAQVYLSKAPHELIVRYMSDQTARELSVGVALRNGTLTPLQEGLTSGACR